MHGCALACTHPALPNCLAGMLAWTSLCIPLLLEAYALRGCRGAARAPIMCII